MKFNIKSLSVSLFIQVCLIYFVSSSQDRSIRSQSMMEYLNGFFSTSKIQNSNMETVHKPHHLKNHEGRRKKYHFRFKERGHLKMNNGTNQSDTPAASSAATNSSNAAKVPDINPILSEWFMISSPAFKNTIKFPPINLYDGSQVTINTDEQFYRINDAYATSPGEKPPSEKFFWFRLSGLNIYYSLTKSDINILGAIEVQRIISIRPQEGELLQFNRTYCFSVEDAELNVWKMCALSENTTFQWMCQIKKLLNMVDPFCDQINANITEPIIIEKNITQPIIIIPLPSRMCNEGWNYQQNGMDWECDCSEGREQSPIDLPAIQNAFDTPVKPLFQYEEVSSVSKVTTIEGQLLENKPLKIQLMSNNLKILHNKFGKLITMDGAVYYAQEIVIHTPGEHTFMGKTFDMELQIIHYGQSKGDIAKQVVLSFMIEKKPGVYNKFFDDLDFFNLPNPLHTDKDLLSNIFIPKIFYSSDDNDAPIMKPFSFYTYQGSLTFPPCTENTIMYVASKPIQLGSTAIQLFQEALRVPDLMNDKGDVIVSNWIPQSNRLIQELNGRPIFHYDAEKYCGPEPVKVAKPQGHYEKIMKAAVRYFYVNGLEPSGIPNAFVVSENEALGRPELLYDASTQQSSGSSQSNGGSSGMVGNIQAPSPGGFARNQGFDANGGFDGGRFKKKK